MLDLIAKSLLKEFIQPAADPRRVTIQIPRSHPKAAALMKLARGLATREQTESGLVIEHGVQRHDADLEFLEALREFGIDVDRIKAEMGAPAPSPAENDQARVQRLLRSATKILPLLPSQGR